MCKSNYILLSLCISILYSCSPGKKPNTEEIRQEMKQRELVRATDSEIMQKGEELGKIIVKSAQGTLQAALLEAIEEKGIKEAINFCQLNAYSLIQSLEDSLDVDIKRVSQKARNPEDQPDSIENEILKAYAYNFSPENAISQLQELDEKNLIYTQPIAIANGLCLNCHGIRGETMQEDIYQHILSKYPEDPATGYALGELRGMWSIKIPKKTVINQL